MKHLSAMEQQKLACHDEILINTHSASSLQMTWLPSHPPEKGKKEATIKWFALCTAY